MGGEWNIEDQESDTETLSGGSMMHYCDEERSTTNEGTFPGRQEDTAVIGKLDSMMSEVDQPKKPSRSKTRFSRQLGQIRTALPNSKQAYPSPSPSTATPSQAYGPPSLTFGAGKRRGSPATYLRSEKRARSNKFIGLPKIEEKVLEISQTRRKRLFLKALVDNVHLSDLPQACKDRKELLKATKQINKVSTIRLADNINQDAPWNVTGMTSTLRHHQVIAVGTMVDWENRDSNGSGTHPKGGILADDMGLGKTIQALALIALRRPNIADVREGRSATLVVCPAGLTAQWFGQVKQHVNDTIVPRVHIYKSNDRMDRNVLKNINLIITSYAELTKSYSNARSSNANSKPSNNGRENNQRGWLHRQTWFRVICDEAQAIKNFASKAFQAVKELDTSCRWALSGTPITNGLEEFCPYFNWLNMPCAVNRKDFISTYCSRSDEGATDLLQNLFTSCMIRRTMGSQLFGRPIVWLPLSHRQIEDVQLSHQERVIYEHLHHTYKTVIKRWDNKGRLHQNRAIALKMITTLRQTVSHIALAKNSIENDLKLEDVVRMREQLEETDPGGEREIMNAVELWIRQAKEQSAIICSKGGPEDSRLKPALDDERAHKTQQRPQWLLADGTLLQSSKIRLLERRLKLVFSEAAGDKIVIFTHFLDMINIIARLCEDHHWTYATYNGGMPSKRRDVIVQDFQSDSGPQILIASIRAAGEGLTLTQANHVFCCEMWW
ncbi:SNF2 family N-terminal domain-containing protein [Halenospora varia]|nr:SNF2 family N-terminal domain-containing protein [Halenospora varia]